MHEQALERDERGKRQEVRRRRQRPDQPAIRRPAAYFRIVRPDTGYGDTDLSYEVIASI